MTHRIFGRSGLVFLFLATACVIGKIPVSAQETGAAALINAIRNGDRGQVDTLLSTRVDVNGREGDGATALHWATHRNDLETVKDLIDAGADASASNTLGATPLWLAATNGSVEVLELLLNAGANPNAALKMGETPLMSAARSGDHASVRLLIEHGADVNRAEFERGQTALMWAAAQQHADVVQLLVSNNADLEARTKVWHQLENTAGNTNPIGNFKMAHGGSTPLLFAARAGDVETARALVEGGANPNDLAAAGTSALVIAAHSGHGALATYLLRQGADPNASDAGYTALHAATLRSQVDLVNSLLEYGADVNALVEHGSPGRRFSSDYSIRYQTIGANAFWLAAKYGEPQIARILARHGADPSVTPSDGTSSLKAAIGLPRGSEDRRNRGLGSTEIDRETQERLTLDVTSIVLDLGVNVDQADQTGTTPLHDAVRVGFPSVVELLVSRGANVNVTNDRGDTPLSLAESVQSVPGTNGLRATRPEIATLLRDLGAGN